MMSDELTSFQKHVADESPLSSPMPGGQINLCLSHREHGTAVEPSFRSRVVLDVGKGLRIKCLQANLQAWHMEYKSEYEIQALHQIGIALLNPQYDEESGKLSLTIYGACDGRNGKKFCWIVLFNVIGIG